MMGAGGTVEGEAVGPGDPTSGDPQASGTATRPERRWAAGGWLAGLGRVHGLPTILAVAVVSRVFSVLAIAVSSTLDQPGWPRLGPFEGPLAGWDGQWYLEIASAGYHAQPIQSSHHDLAFFPAWPMLIRAAGYPGLPLDVVAIALANVLFVVGLVFAWQTLKSTHGEPAATRGATLLAFAPPAFVFSMAYSESLFLVFASAYFLSPPLSRRRPLMMAASVLTRVAGGPLVISAIVAAVVHDAPALRRADLRAAAAGLGAFAVWWITVAAVTTDAFGFLHGALGWQPSSGPAAVARAVRSLDVAGLIGIGFTLLVLAASVALVRVDRPQAAFAIGAVLLALLLGRESSMARYALAAFPAFGVMGRWGGRRGFGLLLLLFVAGQVAGVARAFAFGDVSQPP